MPYRHFYAHGGAPKKNPGLIAPTLESQSHFDPTLGFGAQWPDNYNYGGLHISPMEYSAPAPMTQEQLIEHSNFQFSHPYDQSGTLMSAPYQAHPYTFDSSSLSYNSDMNIDHDQSSLSQVSMHSSLSGSHGNVAYEDGMSSVRSISRKASTISSFTSDSHLCPALLRGGKCNPSLCGPDAPCMQAIPQIEDYIPQNDDQMNDFTTPHTSPQRTGRGQPDTVVEPMNFSGLSIDRPRRAIEKNTTDVKSDASSARQTKKTRARQAHSLVERKYREGLNQRIGQLFDLIQQTKASRAGSAQSSATGQDDDVETEDDDDQSKASSSKVKKSDVLVEAMSYVHSTQRELKEKDEEIERLRQKINGMENWIRNIRAN